MSLPPTYSLRAFSNTTAKMTFLRNLEIQTPRSIFKYIQINSISFMFIANKLHMVTVNYAIFNSILYKCFQKSLYGRTSMLAHKPFLKSKHFGNSSSYQINCQHYSTHTRHYLVQDIIRKKL